MYLEEAAHYIHHLLSQQPRSSDDSVVTLIVLGFPIQYFVNIWIFVFEVLPALGKPTYQRWQLN